MTTEFAAQMEAQIALLKRNGATHNDALRYVEIECGKNREEFHSGDVTGNALVEQVWEGKLYHRAGGAGLGLTLHPVAAALVDVSPVSANPFDATPVAISPSELLGFDPKILSGALTFQGVPKDGLSLFSAPTVTTIPDPEIAPDAAPEDAMAKAREIIMNPYLGRETAPVTGDVPLKLYDAPKEVRFFGGDIDPSTITPVCNEALVELYETPKEEE